MLRVFFLCKTKHVARVMSKYEYALLKHCIRFLAICQEGFPYKTRARDAFCFF